jgi:hypothetical protein
MPRVPVVLERMMAQVHEQPGTTVLDFPFCVAGGNGTCQGLECPNYPASTSGACFREWHEKKVYGLYEARMLPSDCELYAKAPYLSWFEAWRTNRCLTAPEWDAFCDYLGAHSELSALFVYPEIWKAASAPECHAELERRLGKPVEEAWFFGAQLRGGRHGAPSRIEWYTPKCRAPGA